MGTFLEFRDAVNQQFARMASEQLFVTEVSKDHIWDVYLKNFPDGSNPMFRERTEHDCQCCKSFIRACGNVVMIDDKLEVHSIWDIEIGGVYQVVADCLSAYVKSNTVIGVFRHFQQGLGVKQNHEMVAMPDGEGVRKWNHFYFKLPKKFVHTGEGNPREKSKEDKALLNRSLQEISIGSMNTVLELIGQKSLERGEEHQDTVEKFLKFKKQSDLIPEDNWDVFLWIILKDLGGLGRIKNTAIGTLLIDLSEDMELDQAVYRFNHKMDPTRYKRPTSIATPGMIKKAQMEITELGYIGSLDRRHAEVDDITINNVIFANPDTKVVMNVFDELIAEAPDIKVLTHVEEVPVDTFVNDILPKAETVEVYFENQHQNNLMSLLAPMNRNAKNMLKWGNNFSWAYNGEVADSMKELVRQKGGKVDGVLRYTIKWNDGDNNQNDFDAHSLEPALRGNRRNLIDFITRGHRHASSGRLDVDITQPGSEPAVENIIYTNIDRMPVGEYDLMVHNYSHNGGMTGFTAEIEFEEQIHTFVYNKNLGHKEKVKVATVSLDKEGKFKIVKSLKSTTAPKNIWEINTCKFHKVSMIMNSPNHWDGEKTGNRHLFFILEGCKNGEPVRGFFNEFLKEELTEHRKTFEMLGAKMKAEKSENQLSGLGFSSTRRASVICKVTGAFTRTIKVNF